MRPTFLLPCFLFLIADIVHAVSVLDFASATYEFDELGGIHVKVTATPPPTESLAFGIQRVGGTAGPDDISSIPSPATIAPGANYFEFAIAGTDDGIREPDEFMTLQLSSITTNAVVGPGKETVLTIHNAPPRMEFYPLFCPTEGGPVIIHGVRRGDTAAAVSVNYETGNAGTAVAGVDFIPASGSFEFGPGVREKDFTLPKLPVNGRADFTRTMELRFSNASIGATLYQTNLFVLINDREYPANVDLNFTPPRAFPQSVAVQPDGRILMATTDVAVNGKESALVRLHPDGSLDRTFAVPASGRIMKVGLAPEGRILVWGYFLEINGAPSPAPGLARLLPDGRLDPAFKPSPAYTGVYPLLFQANGKILLAPEASVWRLNADGTDDDLFNRNARQWVDDQLPVIKAVEQIDGKILLVRGDGWGPSSELRRINADGSLDASFQPFRARTFRQVIPLADGRVALVEESDFFDALGYWNTKERVLQLNIDGSVDSAFNPDLHLKLPRPLRLIGEIEGKLYVTFQVDTELESHDSLIRLHADGSLDTSFPETRFTRWGDGPALGVIGEHLGGLLAWGTLKGAAFSRVNGVPPISSFARIALHSTPTGAFAMELLPNLDGFTAGENTGAVSIQVQRLGDSTQTATVHYATRDGAARAGFNYTPTAGTLTFEPFETTKKLTVPLIDNAVFQGAPEFQVVLSDPSPASIALGPPLSIAIYDDEPGILVDSFRLSSDGTVNFQVTGANPSRILKIERSLDLKHWETRETLHGVLHHLHWFFDPPVTSAHLFYRMTATSPPQ